MVNAGLNFKKEDEEIDPGKFISFLINKLNSDLNEIIKVEEVKDNRQYMVLSSTFKFSENESETIFMQFLHYYNKRILSLISRDFFNVIKTKKECLNQGCGNIGFYYSMLYFIPFNVDIYLKKCQDNNLTIKNAFNCLINDSIILKEDKNIMCEKCKKTTPHRVNKKFYHTAKDLIIIFDRGENYQNTKFIDFDEILVLSKKEVERYTEVKYQLFGIIEKIENNKNQNEYISFIIKGDNQWVSNRDSQNIISFQDVKKRGTILALFYYCYNHYMSLQSKNSYLNNSLSPQQIDIIQNNNGNFNNNNANRMNSETKIPNNQQLFTEQPKDPNNGIAMNNNINQSNENNGNMMINI
jgi:hypothetical protein